MVDDIRLYAHKNGYICRREQIDTIVDKGAEVKIST